MRRSGRRWEGEGAHAAVRELHSQHMHARMHMQLLLLSACAVQFKEATALVRSAFAPLVNERRVSGSQRPRVRPAML